MSGLGIVLEESDSAMMLRSEEAIALRLPENTEEYATSETLLPPLPESDEEILTKAALAPTSSAVSSSALSPVLPRRPSALPRVASSPSTLKEHQEYREAAAGIQGLDLLSLSMDLTSFSFPSIEPSSPGQTAFPVLSKSHSSSSVNTSPLKRLKSLKDGFRRLSLSRKGSTSNPPACDLASVSTPTLIQQQNKPSLYPIHTEPCLNDASLLSSTSESLRSSTFSSLMTGNNHNTHTAVSTPMCPSHIHLSSQGLLIAAKPRRRTISQSNSATSTTPPLPLPIITLSDSLSTTKRNLVSIEQNFFDNLNSEGQLDGTIDTISMLNTSDDLIDYLIYLSEHKKSVELAYELSKSRLTNSGWCSGQDIENLVLHRDSLLSQIDLKLLKIEEKLNSEFNISILNNPRVDIKSPLRGKAAIKSSLSPSLKDLESRCLFATNSNLLS